MRREWKRPGGAAQGLASKQSPKPIRRPENTDEAPQQQKKLDSFAADPVKHWNGLRKEITIFGVGLKERAENDWKPVAFTNMRARQENCAACLYS